MAELYTDLNCRVKVEPQAGPSGIAVEVDGQVVLRRFRLSERGHGSAHWTKVERDADGLILTGAISDRWRFTIEVSAVGKAAPRARWQVTAEYIGFEPAVTGFDVAWEALLHGVARPFIPGVFYGENRPIGAGNYPRWAPTGEEDDPASSTWWRIRTDRSMTPLVLLQTDELSVAMSTTDRFSHGASGLGFRSDVEGAALSLHFPWREEPRKHVLFEPEGAAPDAAAFTVRPRETVEFAFEVFAGSSGWRPLVRDLYDANADLPAPWMTGAEAANLAAWGLYHWHYDPDNTALYETAGFDRYFRSNPRQWDRRHMHVAWVSGLPYALALARHGSFCGNEEWRNAGLSVIDRIACDGLAPCGVFYPQWTQEEGWTHGWHRETPAPHVAHGRTVAEATWFLLQALISPDPWETGDRLDSWTSAARSNLDFACRIQREDGSFGASYDLDTGDVRDWDGAGGIMWVPALLAGARYWNPVAGQRLTNSSAYADAAIRAGGYYAGLIREERLCGAPEDVASGVTSEDGYNALIAMMALYDHTGDEAWLELARLAADFALSFRMSYNATFDDRTLLGRYDFRSKGADIASPSNQHLHNYGLICTPELLRLWRLTGDDYYFNRARDHVFCFRQFVARTDGDFNARKGMVPEQWFHTDWTHPKGCILPLAHSWCAGWLIWVEDCLRRTGNVFVDPVRRRYYLLEPLYVEDEDWDSGSIQFGNPWETPLDLVVVNVATEERVRLHVEAGASVYLPAWRSQG
jgi:hypothetical protein